MQEKSTFGLIFLGVCLFAGLAFLGFMFNRSVVAFKGFERTVEVKGLSEREVPANIAVWPIGLSAVENDLMQLYAAVEKDTRTVIDFLVENGFDKAEISVSAPKITDKLAQGYDKSRVEFRYMAVQTVTVYTPKVQTVRELRSRLVELGKKGILFTHNYDNQTEYLFTRLNDIKPEMVEEATTKAREVAEKFAGDSNSKLGKIKRARQGLFSITPRDTNNPHIKNIRVVSTVSYYLSD